MGCSQGFEIGSGFSGSAMLGSTHNDHFHMQDGRVRTKTNRSGGVQGVPLNTIYFEAEDPHSETEKPPSNISWQMHVKTEQSGNVQHSRLDPSIQAETAPIDLVWSEVPALSPFNLKLRKPLPCK